MRTKRLLAASTTLVLSLLALPALAEDGKAMPGSACQATTLAGLQSLARSNGTVLNVGDQVVNVICPATKDIESGRLKRTEVKAIDRNPVSGADVNCTVASLRSDGTVHQSQRLASTGSSNNVQTLTFNGHTAAAKGSFNLTCDLPRFEAGFGPSGIVMYNVVEE